MLAFQRKVGELHRAVQGAVSHADEIANRIAHLKVGIAQTPGAGEAVAQDVRVIEARLADVNTALRGDSTIASRNEPVPMSIAARAGFIYEGLLDTRTPVPGFYEDSYDIAAREFVPALSELKGISRDLEALESKLESMGTPWTPGRVPDWDSR